MLVSYIQIQQTVYSKSLQDFEINENNLGSVLLGFFSLFGIDLDQYNHFALRPHREVYLNSSYQVINPNNFFNYPYKYFLQKGTNWKVWQCTTPWMATMWRVRSKWMTWKRSWPFATSVFWKSRRKLPSFC